MENKDDLTHRIMKEFADNYKMAINGKERFKTDIACNNYLHNIYNKHTEAYMIDDMFREYEKLKE